MGGLAAGILLLRGARPPRVPRPSASSLIISWQWSTTDLIDLEPSPVSLYCSIWGHFCSLLWGRDTETPQARSSGWHQVSHQWPPQHQPQGQRHNLHLESRSNFCSSQQHNIKLLISGFLPLRKIFTICNRSESMSHISYNNENTGVPCGAFRKKESAVVIPSRAGKRSLP